MSPEQAEGKPVDRRSDIFSFGAILYEMVSGSRPFPGDTRLALLSAIVNSDPKPLVSPPPPGTGAYHPPLPAQRPIAALPAHGRSQNQSRRSQTRERLGGLIVGQRLRCGPAPSSERSLVRPGHGSHCRSSDYGLVGPLTFQGRARHGPDRDGQPVHFRLRTDHRPGFLARRQHDRLRFGPRHRIEPGYMGPTDWRRNSSAHLPPSGRSRT